MHSGIYLIIAKDTFYVGSSKNIARRLIAHKSNLNKNSHFCKRMQNIYNKYGIGAFSFCTLEEVANEDDILACEQKWLDILFAELHSKHILNTRRVAERNTGVKLSDETKQKISDALKGKCIGKKVTQETREKISKARIDLSKKYTLYDPEGVKYENITYIHQFCRDHGLDRGTIVHVLKGERRHHRWWTADFHAIPRYTFVSPNGIVYRNVYNIHAFSEEHNLNVRGLYELGIGRINSLYGWKKIHDSYSQHDTE